MYCQVTKKTLILYHEHELVIQSDKFNCALCNICGHAAVLSIFLFPSVFLLRCLCLYCLSELIVFFESLFFLSRIN